LLHADLLILDELGYLPFSAWPDLQDAAVQTMQQQAEALSAAWAA
jgi:DNA replication protein DnaC